MPFLYFQSLDNFYGCPGCNDGGIEYIEIIYDGIAKQITFEEYSEIEGSKEVLYAVDDDIPEGKEVGDVKEAAVADTYEREHSYHSDRIPDGITVPDDAETPTVHHKRNKLNPDYDPSRAYQSRDKRRDEWCSVGLLGQVPVRDTAIVPDHWKKMNNLESGIDLYYIK